MTQGFCILVLRTFLISGCAGLMSCSSFEQTRDRGSLMEFETATIPRDYHGLWAASGRSCSAANKSKARLNITPNAIGSIRVQRVWGYSDYTDIIVKMASPGAAAQRGNTFFMQLSLDGRKIRFSQSGDRDERVYHRCTGNNALKRDQALARDKN